MPLVSCGLCSYLWELISLLFRIFCNDSSSSTPTPMHALPHSSSDLVYVSFSGPELPDRVLLNAFAERELPDAGWGKNTVSIHNMNLLECPEGSSSVRMILRVCCSWTFCSVTLGRWWSSRWSFSGRWKMESDWYRIWTDWKGWSSLRWGNVEMKIVLNSMHHSVPPII